MIAVCYNHGLSIMLCRYENLIQVRCLLEGISTDDILNNWHRLLPEYMDKWKQSRKEVTFHLLMAHLSPLPSVDA